MLTMVLIPIVAVLFLRISGSMSSSTKRTVKQLFPVDMSPMTAMLMHCTVAARSSFVGPETSTIVVQCCEKGRDLKG